MATTFLNRSNVRRGADSPALKIDAGQRRGATHDAVIVKASEAGFETAARKGVMRWRFRPGMKDGAKVRTRMRVPIEFKVEG